MDYCNEEYHIEKNFFDNRNSDLRDPTSDF